jgi:hypothetical protein
VSAVFTVSWNRSRAGIVLGSAALNGGHQAYIYGAVFSSPIWGTALAIWAFLFRRWWRAGTREWYIVIAALALIPVPLVVIGLVSLAAAY